MKKIIMVAAAVVMAACSQAATVSWSVNNIRGPQGESSVSGWLVQVYTSDVAFTYEAAKAGTISAWSSSTAVQSGTTTNYRAIGSGTQANSTTVNYYAVIYNAGTVASANAYIVSANSAVTTAASGADVNLAFGAMTATTTANKFLNSSWQNVPEPTSAMLLLLGVAGLALKRKQK